MKPGEEVLIFVRSSSFRLPVNQLLAANFHHVKSTVNIHSAPVTPANKQSTGAMNNLQTLAPSTNLISPASHSTGPVRNSLFTSQTLNFSPILLISTGTGIAPFRGFLHDIIYFHQKKFSLFPVHFYFGCRYKAVDFLYQNEIDQAINDKILTSLHVAYSREPNSPFKHVTNILQDRQEEVWNQIANENAFIYVCGGLKMGNTVREILFNAAKKYGQMTHFEAEDWIQKLQAKKRYIQELWG
jgi:sulfite reductase alpha subunit-like flavoprotein